MKKPDRKNTGVDLLTHEQYHTKIRKNPEISDWANFTQNLEMFSQKSNFVGIPILL